MVKKNSQGIPPWLFHFDLISCAAIQSLAGASTPDTEGISRRCDSDVSHMPRKVKKNHPDDGQYQLVPYTGPTGASIEVRFDSTNETVWATQRQVAEMFDITVSAVSEHLTRLFADGELDATSSIANRSITAPDNKCYHTKLYALDAILAIGYRASSRRATAFRKWATGLLKEYLTKGFALNADRLATDPAALQSLSDQVRALRTSERSLYSRIKDGYRLLACDFDANSVDAKSFFAKLQDRFTFAATNRSSAQILLERADHTAPVMGLQNMQGNRPTKADVVIAKNYLNGDELGRLQRTGDAFLIWLEEMAAAGKQLTMHDLDIRLDDVMRLYDRPLFPGYQGYIAPRAKQHAERELGLYRSAART